MKHREYVRPYMAASIALISVPAFVGFYMGLGMEYALKIIGAALVSTGLTIIAAAVIMGVCQWVFEKISERICEWRSSEQSSAAPEL